MQLIINGSICVNVRFLLPREEAKRAVREAKNRWFQEKAATVDQRQFGGKQV